MILQESSCALYYLQIISTWAYIKYTGHFLAPFIFIFGMSCQTHTFTYLFHLYRDPGLHGTQTLVLPVPFFLFSLRHCVVLPSSTHQARNAGSSNITCRETNQGYPLSVILILVTPVMVSFLCPKFQCHMYYNPKFQHEYSSVYFWCIWYSE